jgi:hypothetical protein
LPTIGLTNDEVLITEHEWRDRNVVHGFGDIYASARFAALLLDLGLRESRLREANLESSPGFRSVSDFSAEVRLWLGYDYAI